MNFELDKDKYTLSHALFWGNSKAQFNKASDTSLHWKGRVVHGLISFVEAIPIVGQIVSLIEYMCAKVILAKPISIKTGDVPVANVKNAEDHLKTLAKEKQEETYRPNINAQKEWFAANDWKTKFNCEHVIKFSQGADDINQILGDGCCFAINIKWGKALGELGTKKIHSLEQLTRRHPYSVDPANLEQLKGLFNVAHVMEKLLLSVFYESGTIFQILRR